MTDTHLPVLLGPVVDALAPALVGAGPHHVVDVTGGRGGHSAALLARLGPRDRLLILDRDPEAMTALAQRFATDPRVELHHCPFDQLSDVLRIAGLVGRVDAVLADLGVSSPQFDDPERGFSFAGDGPLDMRMDPNHGPSAAEWLASASLAEITRVLRDYGEESAARRIAQRIIRERETTPLLRTRPLAELIASIVPARPGASHPATRSFQAIRIHINDELGQLQRFLPQALAALRPGGRLAIISFHSLEDRQVKRFLRAADGEPSPQVPLRADQIPPRPWIALSKGIRAEGPELSANPRARSATLRHATKNPEYAHAS